MQKRILCFVIIGLLSSNIYGQYTYEANQPLYDLHDNANNFQGELAYEVVDDGISPAIDLSFNFSFYGSTFTQARMATNGCLHFGNSGSYCSDYTPDPINGQHTYTLYPFWTDLIRDNNSRMKSWGDSSKMIFGWYRMREYNRNSDNSFEVILWNNNSFDFRYRELDIINHDVLIGEVGSNQNNSYTYLYHDECNTGTTNSSSCVSQNWNATSSNTLLENGGSLYGSGSGNGIDCSNPLNDSSCAGYAEAYLAQQCNLNALYSTDCSGYEEALRDFECDQDPQYSPTCSGYIPEILGIFVIQNDSMDVETFQITEDEVILYSEPFEDFGEEELFDDFFDFDDFTDDEIFIDPIIDVLDTFDPLIESISVVNNVDVIDVFDADELVEVFTRNEILEDIEEIIEEEQIEEIIQEIIEEEVIEELLVEEDVEEQIEELLEEEIVEEVVETFEENPKGNSISRALRVVAQTMRTATDSYTTQNNIGNTEVSQGGGISTSSSPSISDQILSANVQNNTVLQMSGGSDTIGGTSITITPLATLDGSIMSDVQTSDLQGQILSATSSVMTSSEADQIADQIIENNLKQEQEEMEEEQQQSGEYADQTTFVAYLGFVPGFDRYKDVTIPDQSLWYESKIIYSDANIDDNTGAYYNLTNTSINKMQTILQSQVNL
jgi:hypothetical protein